MTLLFIKQNILPLLLQISGVGLMLLAVGSLAIPSALHWKEDTAKLQPLTRQVFWTYAGYIFVTHLCMGLLSLFATKWLLVTHPLSMSINGYICIYFLVRVLIQFFYFDRTQAPPGIFYKLAEIGLVALFLLFTMIYGAVFVLSFWQV